jgi:hypothetical protein
MIGVPTGDKGEDSSRSRQALAARDIEPRIPLRRCRKVPVPHYHALWAMCPDLHVRHLPRGHHPFLDQ